MAHHLDTLSVVVIGLNEGCHLEENLRAATQAAREFGNSEVLYVDSGSDDNSLQIARKLGARVILSGHRHTWNAAQARNAGWRAARGDVIQFLDGDMVLEEGWLAAGLAALGEPGVGAVGGRIHERRLRATFGNRAFGQDWCAHPGVVHTLGGGAMWRRCVLEDLGGFDPLLPLGEDPDISLRAGMRGWELRRLDRGMVSHDLDITGFQQYWRRCSDVGISRFLVAARHPQFPPLERRVKADGLWMMGTLCGVASAFWLPHLVLVVLALWVVVILRNTWRARRDGVEWGDALVRGIHRQFMKIPATAGVASAWLAGQGRKDPLPDRLGVLSSEIPSVSATFVHREARALERDGWVIYPFALRSCDASGISEDGMPFLKRTGVIYGRPLQAVLAPWRHLRIDPIITLSVVWLALSDMVRGSGLSLSQRLKIPGQLLYALDLALGLRARCVRHLHIHFTHAPATVGMYAAHAARLPYSITAHANDIFVQGSLLQEKAERALFYATISEHNRRALVDELGLPVDRVRLLRCGVDTSWFDGTRQESLDKGRILILGRLVPKKGVDLALRAFAQIGERHPESGITVLGDGPEGPGLKALAESLGIHDRVKFWGSAGAAKIRSEMARADVFVLPCRESKDGDRDGIPVALMEAMAMGMAVLSTRFAGIPELISDGESGVLVDPGDVEALARSLEELLFDEGLRRRLGAGARQHVKDRYELETQAELLGSWVRESARHPEKTRQLTGVEVRLPSPVEVQV